MYSLRTVFYKCLQLVGIWPKSHKPTSHSGEDLGSEDYTPSPEDYPVFPPPPPRDIIKDPSQYWDVIVARKFAAPQGCWEDSPLFALYRLYEFIVLDRVLQYRNALEAFWRQREWEIEGIPDPKDDNPERYAFLAGCTYLLTRSFNERIKLGLRRDNPSLITPEEAETARNIPYHLRKWENVPAWAEKVAPLKDTFALPTRDGAIIQDKTDPKADPDFLTKKHLTLDTSHSFHINRCIRIFDRQKEMAIDLDQDSLDKKIGRLEKREAALDTKDLLLCLHLHDAPVDECFRSRSKMELRLPRDTLFTP